MDEQHVWNCQRGIARVKETLKTFTIPEKPESFGKPYKFPEDITKLASSELGKLMSQLAAWKGYGLRLMAEVDIENSILVDVQDSKISKKVAEGLVKKLTKDGAIGVLLTEDEKFKELRIQLIEKSAEVSGLRRILEIYTMQMEALSREITRRGQDIKLSGNI